MKGDKGGMKGEKGGKKGFKGKEAPSTGKGYGSPPGVFNRYCHSWWEWGHPSKYCPKRQDTHSLDVNTPTVEPSSDSDAIQLSSMVLMDAHVSDHHAHYANRMDAHVSDHHDH